KWTIKDSESTPGSKTIDATNSLVVQGADGVTAKVDDAGLHLGLNKTDLSNTINSGPVITNVAAKFKVGAESGGDKTVTADKTGTQTIKFTGDGNIIESEVTTGGVQYKVNETKLNNTLSNTFAKTDASNLNGDNVIQWREKLGVTDNALSQASAWKLQVNDGSERVIGKDDVVNFVADRYTEVTATGNKVKIGLNTEAKEKLDKVDTLEGKIKANKVQVTGDDATGVKVADKKEADGSTTYKVSLGEKIKVGGVTMDGAGANRTITGLTNTSLDVAGFATSQRAATEEQLQAAMTQMSANAKATKVKSGDENIVVNKTEGQNEYTVALNKNLNVDSLNAGGTKVNKDGISVQGADGKPSVAITKDGINAGNKKITNVADGADAHDAATVGQLNRLAGNAGKGLNELGNQIGRLDGRVNKVGAGAAALAALHPVDFDADDKLDVAAGWGHYKGRNAMALGAFYRPDERTMFSLGGTVGNGENMINAGITFKLDKRRGPIHAITSKVQLVQEVTQLKADNDELRKDNAELREQMKEINAKLEKLMAAK
ncbi:MAG: YadA-like family protein, partial [Succiniclasticum sp.]|nr:YadA-like family protein [Succiniclasticum sp.]